MNLVRSVISVFLVILLAVCTAGWIWAGNQPPEKLNISGARFVLALGALAGLGCLWLLWNVNPARIHRE